MADKAAPVQVWLILSDTMFIIWKATAPHTNSDEMRRCVSAQGLLNHLLGEGGGGGQHLPLCWQVAACLSPNCAVLLKLAHYLWDCTEWNNADVLFMSICSATDFTLKPSDCPDTDFPVQIANSDRGCLWYRKDNKFKIPKGEMCVSYCGVCMCICVLLYCVYNLACKMFP